MRPSVTARLSTRLCLLAALLVLPLLPLQAVYDIPALEKVETQVYSVAEKAMPCIVGLSRSENLGMAQGTGCIIARNGLILTAAHVVGEAKMVTVTLPDRKRVQAKVLGADYGRDIALAIITDPAEFPFLELGDSQKLAAGEMVVALGHAGGFDPQRKPPVRFGRVFENSNEGFIRTDCTMVGGDSGGPLLDLNGRVVGVHSSVGTDLSWNNHSPSAAVRQDWDRLIKGDRWGKLQRSPAKRPDVAAPKDPTPIDQAFTGLDVGKLRELLIEQSSQNNGRLEVKSDDMKKWLRDCGMAEEASNKVTPEEIGKLLKRVLGVAGVRVPGKEIQAIVQQDREILLAIKPGLDAVAPCMVSLTDGKKVLAVGTIVRENGFILTKFSDIAKTKTLKAELADGRSLPAVLVRQFEDHDLALVKVDADLLPALMFPNHESGMHLGSLLVSPGANASMPIVGQGVMSVLERDLRDSGGYLGIGMNEVDGTVEASSVVAGGPAAKAGLQRNDRILAIDGTAIHTAQDLSDHIRAHAPDSVVQIKYRRGSEEKTADVTLGDRAKQQAFLRKENPLAKLGTEVSERKNGFPLVFQHDQPLRPQDCGGVILDLHGNVVGVNVARVGRIATYAVPSRLVFELLETTDFQQLEEKAAAEIKK